MDGADTQYSQLYNAINAHPYAEAGISGFNSPEPFQLPPSLAYLTADMKFARPTLSELNIEFSSRPWRTDEERLQFFAGDSIAITTFYTGPPPAAPAIPSSTSIVPNIINSLDKLFFISHKIGLGYTEWQLVCLALADSLTGRAIPG